MWGSHQVWFLWPQHSKETSAASSSLCPLSKSCGGCAERAVSCTDRDTQNVRGGPVTEETRGNKHGSGGGGEEGWACAKGQWQVTLAGNMWGQAEENSGSHQHPDWLCWYFQKGLCSHFPKATLPLKGEQWSSVPNKNHIALASLTPPGGATNQLASKEPPRDGTFMALLQKPSSLGRFLPHKQTCPRRT